MSTMITHPITDTDDKITLPSGSTRSADVPLELRIDLVPWEGLERLALRYGVGAKQHGDRNWERGQPAEVVIAHLVRHLWLWMGGDRGDDHLAAAAWGLFCLMHHEARLPEMLEKFRPSAPVEPPAIVASHELDDYQQGVISEFKASWHHVPSPPPSHGPGGLE